MKFIKKFEDLRITDTPTVGGKNASLGQMISQLSAKGVTIPTGFAVTAQAYWHYLDHNNLREPIKKVMTALTDHQDIRQLQKVGHEIRSLIEQGAMPDDLAQEISQAYQELCKQYGQENLDVAVRSSATAEDLPTASFAGQQETFLNVRGDERLIESCKKCMASLFTDRAIVDRIEQGFDHFQVALSVGVQKMVRADKASAGVAFSLDTETGFKDVVMIESSYGLGETIVKGLVVPDEFFVHKPTFAKGFSSIIKKQLGKKKIKLIYDDPLKQVEVPENEQQLFSLTDKEILELVKATVTIEDHYTQLKGSWAPMDVEWAKDGVDGKLYILQARPETVHATKVGTTFEQYALKEKAPQPLLTGQSIGQKIATGVARVIKDVKDIVAVQEGDILVTQMTDPDWVPAMKKAAGIITERGGRTCHAAIVSRELGVPAIIGASLATTKIKTGQKITLDCSKGKTGFIYDGALKFETQTIELEKIPKLPVELLVNIADPDRAFTVSMLPVGGVGLARLEFIINNAIKIHPMALLQPEKVEDAAVKKQIDELTVGYTDKKDFFIDSLSQGIAMIAAGFYPRPVIVRLSDFKTNEYRNLIGGAYFEPVEENPMLGFRGASRYQHELYKDAFALECAALKKVRDGMGLTNVKIMVPFVRTTQEAEGVLNEMKRHGLQQGENNLEIIMMCEIPSNVVLIDEFSKQFDGFSIGSNDLTQLTLGVDRDSELLADIFDERDPAVKKMLRMAIEGAQKNKRPIGICGQAPSDFPELAEFLMEIGINSISLNPDSVLPFLMRNGGG